MPAAMSTMSIPSIVHIFEVGINAPPTGSLDSLIRHKLEMVSRELPLPPIIGSSALGDKTLIREMGEYFTQMARIFSRLTDDLVRGAHVELAIMDVHEKSRIQTKVSDLSTVVAMDVEHTRLRKIRDLTEKFSRDVEDVWRTGSTQNGALQPPSAFASVPETQGSSSSRPPTGAGDVDPRAHNSFPAQPTQTQPGQIPPGQILPLPRPTPILPNPYTATGSIQSVEDSDDEDEKFSKIDMEALKQRGKGSYYCPLGTRCDKGGVDKAGNLVVFDRNSSFAQHCNKHCKPWRCDVPGCPNPPKKRKFARRDGLERHKQTVKHVPGT